MRWVCYVPCVWVALAGSLAYGQTEVTHVGTLPEDGSIVVLPFANLGQRPAEAWIGDGLAETVATTLSAAGHRVVDRTLVRGAFSVRVVPGRDRFDDARALEVCRGLGAAVLVWGTYDQVGDRLRVSVEVVSVRSGDVVRKARIEGSVHDVFAAQDEVAAAVAQQLTPSTDRAPTPRAGDRFAPADDGLSATDVTGRLALPADEDTLGQGPSGGGPGRQRGGGFAITGPTVFVSRTSQPPIVDGRLDDPLWRGVTPITSFVQTSPVEGAAATEPTEVWLAYDSDNIYLAFYAHYADPGIIRANRAERDKARGDDQMSVLFDPFLDQQRAYMFSVNGYGVPGDAIVNAGGGGSSRRGGSVGRSSSGSGGGGSSSSGGGGGGAGPGSSGFGIRGDSSWDALFEVRGGLVDDGWTAEMAIPFKSCATRRGPPANRTGGDCRLHATSATSLSRRSGRRCLATSPVS